MKKVVKWSDSLRAIEKKRYRNCRKEIEYWKRKEGNMGAIEKRVVRNISYL